MNYLSEHNTLKSLRSIADQNRDMAVRVASMVSRGLLEPGTHETRAILQEVVFGAIETASMLEGLIEAVATKNPEKVRLLVDQYSIRGSR